MSDEEITTVTSRIAYQNRWLRLREDVVRRRDGSEGLYGVVVRPDFVVVVPYHDGCITLVEQYRYPVRRRLWELPMGTSDHPPGSDPALGAAAELREETGLVAGRMRRVGEVLQGPGFCDQTGHVFLATELTQGPTAREVTEQGMICRAFTLDAIDAMIGDGRLMDGLSLAALTMVRIKHLVP